MQKKKQFPPPSYVLVQLEVRLLTGSTRTKPALYAMQPLWPAGLHRLVASKDNTKASFLPGMEFQIPGLEALLSAAAVRSNHFLPGRPSMYFCMFFKSPQKISLNTSKRSKNWESDSFKTLHSSPPACNLSCSHLHTWVRSATQSSKESIGLNTEA